MAQVCQDSDVHRLHARSSNYAQSRVTIIALVKELRPRRSALRRPQDLSRGLRYECDEYNHATVEYKTLYMYSLLITIRDFSSEGRTMWVRHYYNLARVMMRNVLPLPPGTYMYAHGDDNEWTKDGHIDAIYGCFWRLERVFIPGILEL
jgi:hypothetical protein